MKSLCVLSVFFCVLCVETASAQLWRPDERILITSFLNARGLATDDRHVWVSTDNGLEIYDIDFKRWLPPSTMEDGYPVREGAGRIAYDSRRRELWLATDAQSIYSWSPVMQTWERRFLSDIPNEIREQLQRRADNSDPAWRVVQSSVNRDLAGRRWQISDLQPADRAGTFWAAMYGNNFAFVDSRNLGTEPFSFGTISRGVTAIGVAQNGDLFFGGDGIGPRTGVTRADSTLQRWTQFEARVATGPQRRVRAIIDSPHGVYAGAADGLYLLQNGRWRLVAEGDVGAIVTSGDRVYIGTRGTLGWFDGAGIYTPVITEAITVNGLATRNDTLWVAAQSGVFRYTGDGLQQMNAAPAASVAATASQIVAMTNRGLVVFDSLRWTDVARHASLASIGRLHKMKAIGESIWFGGDGGVAEWNTSTNEWRHLIVPADIPEGPVFDVAIENNRVWVATPAGALRLQWR